LIETAAASESLRIVAKRFGITVSSLNRHKHNCSADALHAAQSTAKKNLALDLIGYLQNSLEQLGDIASKAIEAQDFRGDYGTDKYNAHNMAVAKSRTEAVRRITEGSLHSGRSDRHIKYGPFPGGPLPSQRRFHNLRSLHKGFSGPVGSGKSLALVYEALRLSLKNQGLLGLIGAPTYPLLRDSTQRSMFEFLDRSEIPYTFQKQENLLTFTDFGSEIIFRSLENTDHLVGTNVAWFGVDELTYCKEASFLKLQARMRHPLATELCGYGVWTPNGFDWVYGRFIGPHKQPDYACVLATPGENRYLPGGYYENLSRSYDPRLHEQEVLGAYLAVKGNRVYYAFDRVANVKPIEYIPNGELFWSLDFNVNPMCSVIAQVEDLTTRYDVLMNRKNARLNVLDEIVLPDANIGEVCNEFVRRTEKMTARSQVHVQLYGDASGGARTHAGPSSWQLVTEYFRNKPEYKLVKRVPMANPPIKDRVNSMNAMLLNNSGERRLAIDPRCKELIADFEQVQWKADANGNQTADLDKKDPKRTHISDALGYLIFGEFPIRQRVELQKQSIYGIS